MKSVTMQAPAKLNLGLGILGAYPDGYHRIESVFSCITLSDTVTVALDDEPGGTTLSSTGIPSPCDETNIAWKAAEACRNDMGISSGIHISLHKNIPSPGGLGGGSSDCAAVLLALMKLGCGCVNLERIALGLGCDVPFFISRHPSAIVTGRGEKIIPVTVPPFHCVLVDSGARIPTPLAYGLWDEANEEHHLTEPYRIGHYTALYFGVWHEGKPFPVRLDNHFLPVLGSRYFEITAAARELSLLTGNWGLSGSGPVLYGLFRTEQEAREAEEHLNGKFPWVFRCRSRHTGASSNG
jgi:4-diphosphocytidyl-2-C-methyl-D-erythritol kinase